MKTLKNAFVGSLLVSSSLQAFPMKTHELVEQVFQNPDFNLLLNQGNSMFNDVSMVERIPLTGAIRGQCRWTSKSASAVRVTFEIGGNKQTVLFGTDGGPDAQVSSCNPPFAN